MRTLYAAKEIHVGVHPTIHILGLAIDVDIVTSTLVAAAILTFLVLRVRAKATSGVPGKLQLMFELLYEQVSDLAASAIGPKGRRFVPIGMTIFMFVLISNWIGFIPSALQPGVSSEILPSPTGDVNLPLAMALLVIVWVHVESLRARGLRGYLGHYAQPYAALAPINIIEEITKPITLTFRLFGNIFSGGLMILVMTTLLPVYVVPFGEIIWKPFDLFIGAIQAFIFMLLTILYFGMAMSTDHTDEHDTASTGALTAS